MNWFILFYCLTKVIEIVNCNVLDRNTPILHDDVNTSTVDEDVIDLTELGPRLFGTPDEESGKRLANWDPETDSRNPDEIGSYLGGDMLIINDLARNGVTMQSARWPGAVIPFAISGSFNAVQMQMIEDAMKEYHSKTCIRFKPRTNEHNFIRITNDGAGCFSGVGRVGNGPQDVNLQTPACFHKIGVVIHELMHAIGFYHEQNRVDRDDSVTIYWQNVQKGSEDNFHKAASTHAFNVPYDYSSVLHYSPTAFSINGQPTIAAKRGNSHSMGQREGLSSGDVQKLNAMYNCGSQPGNYNPAPIQTGNQIFPQPSLPPQPPPPPPTNTANAIGTAIGNAIGNAVLNVFGGLFGSHKDEVGGNEATMDDTNDKD